jgi:hypothetical protein
VVIWTRVPLGGCISQGPKPGGTRHKNGPPGPTSSYLIDNLKGGTHVCASPLLLVGEFLFENGIRGMLRALLWTRARYHDSRPFNVFFALAAVPGRSSEFRIVIHPTCRMHDFLETSRDREVS